LQALYFRRCTHLVVEDLEVRDSMQMHVAIAYSWNVVVSKLFITAPVWSPNTDGIHVSNSKEVSIRDCDISTGTVSRRATETDSFRRRSIRRSLG
jgi:polygalacturonase